MSENEILIPVKIRITRLSDGESADIDYNLYTTVDYNGLFLWSEGNYSCDCNRALLFNEAYGLPDPDESCGSSKYQIDFIKEVSSGKILYTELE